MNTSDMILISILAIIPQLGYFIYSHISKKRPIRGQIFEESLYILSRERERIFIGGIIAHEPQTIHEESTLEFAHKILEFIPFTLNLVKGCNQTRIYMFPFASKVKTKMKNNFNKRIQKVANILETLFTPRKIQIMTGTELYEKMRDEYGRIPDTGEKDIHIYTRKVVSSIFELGPLDQRENWKKRLFLLNCLLELGLEISLSFTIRRKKTHIYSAGQIRLSGSNKKNVIEGVKILKKGGSLLLVSSTSQKHEKKELHREMTESALQIVPYLERKISLRNLARLIQFWVQNASKTWKHSFSAPEISNMTLLIKNRKI